MTRSLKANAPVLVFDSGAGGISVLRELVKLMPAEDFIYYGDSKNAPYGTREQSEVRDLTFEVVEDYISYGIKGVCVACNSATSAAVAELRKVHPDIPIVGIEPAVKPAVEAFPGGRILVMATPMTVALPKFKYLISKFVDKATIIPLAAPGLMEFVERGETGGEVLTAFLIKILSPYIGNIDALVTGCTHYPFVADTIQSILGDGVRLFDGGEGTARYMKHCLNEKGLLRVDDIPGSIEYVCSSRDAGHIKVFKELMSQGRVGP